MTSENPYAGAGRELEAAWLTMRDGLGSPPPSLEVFLEELRGLNRGRLVAVPPWQLAERIRARGGVSRLGPVS